MRLQITENGFASNVEESASYQRKPSVIGFHAVPMRFRVERDKEVENWIGRLTKIVSQSPVDQRFVEGCFSHTLRPEADEVESLIERLMRSPFSKVVRISHVSERCRYKVRTCHEAVVATRSGHPSTPPHIQHAVPRRDERHSPAVPREFARPLAAEIVPVLAQPDSARPPRARDPADQRRKGGRCRGRQRIWRLGGEAPMRPAAGRLA